MTADAGLPTLANGVAPSRRGKGFLAVCGTFVYPGVGHFIAGANRRGLFWLVARIILDICGTWLIIRVLLVPLIIGALLAIAVMVGACIDAYIAGRRSRRNLMSSAAARYGLGVLLLLVVILTIHNFVHPFEKSFVLKHMQAFKMASRGMMPTLAPNDMVLVAKQVTPRRWDLAVFFAPWPGDHSVILQRVVGLPGETVEITPHGLLIDGKEVTLPAGLAPYQQARGRRIGNGCVGSPIMLGLGEYFMLGDETAVSRDSRYWTVPVEGHQPGALPADYIVGVAKDVYWPLNRAKSLEQ